MFICQLSGELSAPREKQHRLVVETRPATYYNGYEGSLETIISSGSEIVKELLVRLEALDPAAAVKRAAAQTPYDYRAALAASAARYDHARRCKKPLDDCMLCKVNIQFFSQLPLQALSYVTEEVYHR
jgi:hypothetical protein